MYHKTSRIAESNAPAKSTSIKHRIAKLQNVTVGYLGPGNVFGDVDVVMKRNYMYTLKSNSAGSSVYMLKATAFWKFFAVYKDSFRLIKTECLDCDLRLMK